ncbi:Transcription factor jumonji/aspartyl beta-hydroxylase [Penicillium digitatum]|uniref:Transcription factor jumonji/aspartyl beta-hydroxylase n=1 Tax=Penicillium digitatum TaxID=36651 RepID=A0A7T7BM70_PENDI|nr:Transcription factor jumonji/aspartyl beta-hydroxylase [Penicillium digitatum]
MHRPLIVLENATLDTFKQRCFLPEQPAVLPPSTFKDLPALKKWFKSASPKSTPGPSSASLNVEHLYKHGVDTFVPLELTESTSTDAKFETDSGKTETHSFRQFHAPLTLFLDWMRTAETTHQSTRLYLAQCQLLDLPPVLREDFPTPELVARAGKGDIYDTNVWIGHPPTYTPLHRDPNPNLFVQMAGKKVVRLLAPVDGQAVFGAVRRQLGKSGSPEAAAFRGEEMMQGRERALLDEMVWGTQVSTGSDAGVGFEAHLEAGDGVFIPKGWWHSIKGVGEGVTASVNWWFR